MSSSAPSVASNIISSSSSSVAAISTQSMAKHVRLNESVSSALGATCALSSQMSFASVAAHAGSPVPIVRSVSSVSITRSSLRSARHIRYDSAGDQIDDSHGS
jgi:hypothetical protein